MSNNIAGIDLKRAMMTAVAAAFVGGLAGALKAFADRHDRVSDAEEPEQPPQPENEVEEEPEVEREDPRDEEPENEAQPDDESQDEEGEEPAEQPAQTGAASGDVEKVILRAKEHVERVLGEDSESISGLDRRNGNWCVNVEIVKLHRIPESTDVLASYEVVVDEDGDLVSLQETRRYRRAQSEEER